MQRAAVRDAAEREREREAEGTKSLSLILILILNRKWLGDEGQSPEIKAVGWVSKCSSGPFWPTFTPHGLRDSLDSLDSLLRSLTHTDKKSPFHLSHSPTSHWHLRLSPLCPNSLTRLLLFPSRSGSPHGVLPVRSWPGLSRLLPSSVTQDLLIL
jgi:hypothetical protein